MKLLLVEDESKIAEFIRNGLREEGYFVDIAESAEKALLLTQKNTYNGYIIDIMLPGMDGISLCRKLRETGTSDPIMMLTAKGSISDKVTGLDSGADDYLTKPFVFDELAARMRALLRKSQGYNKLTITVGDLRIDPADRFVELRGVEVDLSKKEFQLLVYLAQNKNQVVTRSMISKAVWENEGNTFSNIIDVFITHLRKKIDGDSNTKLIHTIRGRGFMLSDNAQED